MNPEVTEDCEDLERLGASFVDVPSLQAGVREQTHPLAFPLSKPLRRRDAEGETHLSFSCHSRDDII